jgi:hypothetical protein
VLERPAQASSNRMGVPTVVTAGLAVSNVVHHAEVPGKCSLSAVVRNLVELSVLIPSRSGPMSALSDRQEFILSTKSVGG